MTSQKSPGVTVVIPTIPPRERLLRRALASVEAQSLPAAATVVTIDRDKEGAARTRQRGLESVTTEWTAFLDDDDEFMPGHLEALLAVAEARGADMIYSWFEVVGGADPLAEYFGKPWDPENPVTTTITTLVRTDRALSVGGFTDPVEDSRTDRAFGGEDERFVLRMNASGAVIHHLPLRTWIWHHHRGNTSGLPTRWR